MRLLIYMICLVAITCQGLANPKQTFQKLVETNHYWIQQPDVNPANMASFDGDDRAYIKYHLQLVEQVLRQRSTHYLSPSQQANRTRALNELNAYWKSEAFPINDQYQYRTPIFIDPYDNFCAVGYLLKATGFESIARTISKENNLIYVKDISNRDLLNWAHTYGFKKEELAWIQPTYNYPTASIAGLGRGVNGHINTMYLDNENYRIYFGGSFDKIDNKISTNNIGFYEHHGHYFHFEGLGEGVNGPVHAIYKDGNDIIAGGEFSKAGTISANNIAIWTNNHWQSYGCINGIVKSIIRYNNQLYIAGSFTECNKTGVKYGLAKWENNQWQLFKDIKGTVNALHEFFGDLIIGGYFDFNGNQIASLRYNDNKGLQPFSGKLNAEISSFAFYKNKLYAGLNDLDTNEINLCAFISKGSNEWEQLSKDKPIWENSFKSHYGMLKKVTALCVVYDVLHISGNFKYLLSNYYYPHSLLENNININLLNGNFLAPNSTVYATNGTVNSVVYMNGVTYYGGDFILNFYSMGLGYSTTNLPNAIHEGQVNNASIAPNPSADGIFKVLLKDKNDYKASVYDQLGRIVQIKNDYGTDLLIDLSSFPNGTYFLELLNSDGQKQHYTLMK